MIKWAKIDFVRANTSTLMHEFQNNLALLIFGGVPVSFETFLRSSSAI